MEDNDQNVHKFIKICTSCFEKESNFFIDCGCYLCPECISEMQNLIRDTGKTLCISCDSSFKRVYQLDKISNKIKKVELITQNPIKTLQVLLQSFQLSEMNNDKHINYLKEKNRALVAQNKKNERSLQDLQAKLEEQELLIKKLENKRSRSREMEFSYGIPNSRNKKDQLDCKNKYDKNKQCSHRKEDIKHDYIKRKHSIGMANFDETISKDSDSNYHHTKHRNFKLK